MLLYFLMGAGIGLLASLVVVIGKMCISNLIARIRNRHTGIVILQHSKQTLANILTLMNQEKKEKETADVMSLEEFEQLGELFGEEGAIEYTEGTDGKVKAEDISILQADTMEDKLSALFAKNNGKLVIQT